MIFKVDCGTPWRSVHCFLTAYHFSALEYNADMGTPPGVRINSQLNLVRLRLRLRFIQELRSINTHTLPINEI